MKSVLLIMATLVSANAFAGVVLKCDGLLKVPSGKKIQIMQSHLELRPTSDEKNLLVSLSFDGNSGLDAYLAPIKKNSGEGLQFDLATRDVTYAVSLKNAEQKMKGSDAAYFILTMKTKIDKKTETAEAITACTTTKE